MRLLLTNDDGWDAPGLAALADVARRFGEVTIVAPRDPHSYAGHRVTTDQPLHLTPTGDRCYHLSGTPADCVRLAIRGLGINPDWVLAGINRGGNLGADIHISGTVAAAREAALLGVASIAVSQYVRRDLSLDWAHAAELAHAAIAQLLNGALPPKEFWNVNLPHLPPNTGAETVHCDPDNEPLDVRFRCDEGSWRYSGTYAARPRTPGRDVDHCFGGAITVSRLIL